MYTALSRLMGDGGRVRVFCYDIVKENRRHLFTTKIILSVSLVWPEVLWQKDRFLFPRNSVVSGPPRQPFLSTLQTIIMSREISCELEQSVRVLRLLCGWSEIGNGKEALELQALDLVRVIQDSGYVTLEMKPGMLFIFSSKFIVPVQSGLPCIGRVCDGDIVYGLVENHFFRRGFVFSSLLRCK